ncbi:chaperonin 10-like protein [Emericellopsis atlantica]|uniref:Chaperonin 10-like protein n=1 Tax=Emericellopsis atlantica TaxID=2614577 RepID=A0A9P7ZTM3_9HYPO|nr:chaperonin 10-like protein [Emericellopsis atlantica]KAG9258128.1 chaperonin 10-like protein [Emericellopsis atlantica]
MATVATRTTTVSSQPLVGQPTLKSLPQSQRVLLLHGKGQQYQVHADGDVPQLRYGDLLVEIHAIGLNPIDWKSAAFGFGLPQLPSLNRREFVGKIVASEVEEECALKPGEWVLAVSTDYRDFRKAAFQEFAIVCCYNAVRIPCHIDPFRVASIGVAYVAAGLALGVCLGVLFTKESNRRPFNLLDVARKYTEGVSEDVAPEIYQGIPLESRPQPGDWILVYGASSITAQVAIQLAKMSGLRVVGVANLDKHRRLLESLRTDHLIDRTDLDHAKTEITSLFPGSLRFAIDTVGGETASWCQGVLAAQHSQHAHGSSHLVALTGKPKTACPSVRVHSVPIKLFHANRKVGGHLSKWLHELLDGGKLHLPEVEYVDGGLDAVNSALDRLKTGSISGRRLVVTVKQPVDMSGEDPALQSQLAG